MSGGSGGYLEFVFRYAAKSLFNLQIDGPLEYKAGRNADFKELILEVRQEQVFCILLECIR
jgi:hypothetical protein